MQHAEPVTLAELREFLAASNTLSFAAAGRRQVYGLVERGPRAQQGIVNLSGQGQRSGVVPNKRASFSSLILGTRHLTPLVKRLASQDAIVSRIHAVTTQPEQAANRSMAR